MTIPVVVQMTVDSGNSYELSAESNLQDVNLDNELVINVEPYPAEIYEGAYTVDAGLSAVTLDTDGKICTDDIVVNALQAQHEPVANSFRIKWQDGSVEYKITVGAGYNSSQYQTAYKTGTLHSGDLVEGGHITPTTSEQRVVAPGKVVYGDFLTVDPIPSPYYDCSGVTAQASDVLSGKYFVNSSGVLTLGTGSGGMDSDTKDALLDCFEHVAWIGNDGEDYYNALLNALYPLQSISAVYTQSGTVYTTTSLDDLKSDLVVTATFEDNTTKTVTNYTLSGTLTVGTSTITVTYFTETTTFNVTVSQGGIPVVGIWHIGIGIYQSGIETQVLQTDANDNSRAVFSVESGTHALNRYSGATKPATYPIEIPSGVTGIKVTCDTDMYAGIISCAYSSSQWKVKTKDAWLAPGTTTCTFDPSATHWVGYAKKGSAGTSAITDRDVALITFEYTEE